MATQLFGALAGLGMTGEQLAQGAEIARKRKMEQEQFGMEKQQFQMQQQRFQTEQSAAQLRQKLLEQGIQADPSKVYRGPGGNFILGVNSFGQVVRVPVPEGVPATPGLGGTNEDLDAALDSLVKALPADKQPAARSIAKGYALMGNYPEAFKTLTAFSEKVDIQRDLLEERYREAKMRSEDQAATREQKQQYQQEMLALRQEMLQLAMQRLAEAGEKSKVPQVLQSRVTQAQIAREQLEGVEELLGDPQLKAYLGPVMGTAGVVTRRTVPKVQAFEQALQSLINLNPILHGYRGGGNVHAVFEAATGNLTYYPENLLAGLAEQKKFLDRIIEGAEQIYKGDPFFKALKESQAVGKETSTASSRIPDEDVKAWATMKGISMEQARKELEDAQ